MNKLTSFLILLIGCSGCVEDPVFTQRTIRLDLTRCLGPLTDVETTPDSDCGRKKINTIIDSEARANGCLVLKRDGQPLEHHLLRWQNGALTLLGDVMGNQQLRGQLQANLILYAQSIDQDACDTQRLDSQCAGQCIVRLRDLIQVMQTATDTVSIDFANNTLGDDACDIVWNEDIHASLEEICDGVDNNCNGLVDESEQCCARHEDCQTVLADLFCDPVLLECVGCTRNSDCENKFERRTFCNLETGRCGECDPQPDTVSTHRCPSSEPRCITTENGRSECRDCNPNGPIEENGCPLNRPCYAGRSPADAPECIRCVLSSDCPEPLECVRLALNLEDHPSHGSCQDCSPVNSGPNARCEAIDSGVNPYCSIYGTCVPCLRETQAQACPDEAAPYCLTAEDGSATCGPCDTDLDCLNLSPAEPYCDRETNRCFTCRPGTRGGCSGSTPICNVDGASCRPCTAEDTCGSGTCVIHDDSLDCDSINPEDLNELCLQIGQCRECGLEDSEADPNQSCTAEHRPICRNDTCIGCETNADCPVESPSCSHLGNCTQCPIAFAFLSESRQVDYRCNESGGTPICSTTGACQACDADSDCLNRPGNRNVCEAGLCVGCRDAQINGCTDPSKPICDIESDDPVCVECLDSSQCRDGFACIDEECIGGCNPVTQTGCEREQPVCTERADCRSCTNTDCLPVNEAIAQSCADSIACRLCVNPADTEPESDAGVDQNDEAHDRDVGILQAIQRESAYGCTENSSRPICNNGECTQCRNSAQCTARPGSNDYCLPTGVCAPCLPDSSVPNIEANDDGCQTPEAPFCRRSETGYACAQCNDNDDCANGTLACIEGECQVCDLSTHMGCPDELPICREVDGAIRCTGCEINTECRVKDCNGDETCTSSASCDREARRCKACFAGVVCIDHQACNGRACVPCVVNEDCGDRQLGLTCVEGLCHADRCNADSVCEQNFLNCNEGTCWFCKPGTLCSNRRPCVYGDSFPVPMCTHCRDAACPRGLLCELDTGSCR